MEAVGADGDSLRAQIELEHNGELLVGQSILLGGKRDRNKNCKFVVAAPIMRVPIMISDTVNPYLAMRSAIQSVRTYNTTNRDGPRYKLNGIRHGLELSYCIVLMVDSNFAKIEFYNPAFM